jgi:hypothetical protein
MVGAAAGDDSRAKPNLRVVERALGVAMTAALPGINSGEQSATGALRTIAASLEAQAAELQSTTADVVEVDGGGHKRRAGAGAGGGHRTLS